MRYHLIALVLILLQTAACGFKPLHSVNENALTQVEVGSIKGEQAYKLRGYLEDAMYFGNSQEIKSVKLDVDLVKTSDNALMAQDYTVIRKDLKIVANYKLTKIKDGRVIDAGTVKVIGGLEEVKSPFATFVQEEKIYEDSMQEIAKLLKIKICMALQ